MSPAARVSAGYLALFTALYALQGIVIAYFFNFNQIYMAAAGVPAETVATVQSVALIPFIFKFLGGPLSDRVNLLGLGHRKPYIMLGLLIQSLGLIGLAWLDPGKSLQAFAAVAVVTVTGLALYDTCCDGMVIDVTPPDDRCRVQGFLVAARAIAAMICSTGFGVWLDAVGQGAARFHYVLWACAGLGVIPLMQALWLAEPIRARDAETFHWRALRVLLLPRSLTLIAFGALYSVVGYGVEINMSPFYKSLDFSEKGVGLLGSVRYLGRAVGAGAMTAATLFMGRKWVMAIGIIALAASTASQWAVAGQSSAVLGGFAFGAANGWNDAVFFVLAMEASDPRMAASTYALFMAVTNVSVLGGSLFSSVNSAVHGFRPAFVVSGLAALLSLLFVPALSRPASKPEPVDVVA